MSMYTLKQQSSISKARLGEVDTPHGKLQTPFFMTIATTGAVKTLDTVKMERLNTPLLLSNTYHLYLRPGTELLRAAGGLHEFMNWDKPILTDSGGYQVFSLAKMRKISEKGVEFKSHLDGTKHMLTPEKSIEVQLHIGSDMLMVLDECPPAGSDKRYMFSSLERTTRWAKRCKEFFDENTEKLRYGNLARPKLFGIVQGGLFPELRDRSLEQLSEIDFDGMAIGGVSVGESSEDIKKVVEYIAPKMPKNKPRYLMGLGFPEEIVFAVQQGVDMFDCVIPTRHARHGSLFVFTDKENIGKGDFYNLVSIKKEDYKKDFSPIDENCECLTCKNYSKAYVRYLFHIGEMLGYRLASIHNVHFYLELMRTIQRKIKDNQL